MSVLITKGPVIIYRRGRPGEAEDLGLNEVKLAGPLF